MLSDLSLAREDGNRASLWTFSLQEKKAEPFGGVEAPGAVLARAAFSPDGWWIAYGAGSEGVNVQPFPATGAKYQISATGISPLWSPDGKEIFYFDQGGLFLKSVATRPTFTFGNPVAVPSSGSLYLFGGLNATRRFDISPDGRFIAVIGSGQTASGTLTAPQIQVVLNWFDELKAKVPTK